MNEAYGKFSVHPVAELFPLMTGSEFDELVAAISESGLQVPIVLAPDGERIVDGRNRYHACEIARVDPIFETLEPVYDEPEIVAFILNANLYRRHLTVAQRSMLAVDLKPLMPTKPHGTNQHSEENAKLYSPPYDKNRDTANSLAGRVVGVSGTSVAKASRIAENAPHLVEQVRAGSLSLDDAVKQTPPKTPRPENGKSDGTTLTLYTDKGVAVPYPKPQSKPTFNQTNEHVSWAMHTWNPVTGCRHECVYCYARALATSAQYKPSYPVGFTPLFHSEPLQAPANTKVPQSKDPRSGRVFVCSMADLYGKWVPAEWIHQVHAEMSKNPQWEYLMLTKFPSRYLEFELPATGGLARQLTRKSA